MSTLSPTGDFWLFLDSTTDNVIFPGNVYNKFNCILPMTIVLKQTESHLWQVAITDILLKDSQSDRTAALPNGFVILSSLVQPSIIRGTLKPVLRQFFHTAGDGSAHQSLFLTQYMPIRDVSFNHISFKVLDSNLNDIVVPPPTTTRIPNDSEQWIIKSTQPELSLILHFQVAERMLPANL